MLVLLGFAFIAGMVTVLSPCILPLLPIILSGSSGGGKNRPLGIIAGFVLSFTVFTLSLSTLVLALGISPDVLRVLAAVLILAFGLVMMIPPLKNAFMAFAQKLTSRQGTVAPGKQNQKQGFSGGFVVGLSLGMVWTPCVGPIMASVITLAATQSVSFSAVFITLAYTLGTALPMFLIMLGGRSLLARMPFLTKHSSRVQQVFGFLMILTGTAILLGIDRDIQTWLLTVFPEYGSGLTGIEHTEAVTQELEKQLP